MKKLMSNPIVIASLLFVGLVLGGNALLTLIGTPPETFGTRGITQAMLPFRLAAYIIIVAAWPLIAPLLARPRAKHLPEDMDLEELNRRQKDITSRLSGIRWYVAGFFALFEIIFIQRIF